MSEIHGYWHKLQDRCDFCHRVAKAVYVVSSGPCTGKFCSALHFKQAQHALETSSIPDHELAREEE